MDAVLASSHLIRPTVEIRRSCWGGPLGSFVAAPHTAPSFTHVELEGHRYPVVDSDELCTARVHIQVLFLRGPDVIAVMLDQHPANQAVLGPFLVFRIDSCNFHPT
ncbi:hypothetical protein CRG98_005048 [Punica granatum]|uniref:Uncharacterized protein n=1 Tax=Punica granatum TaxID=22663 RepID=A0A2I0L1Y9_PUNGR|nr:hypothetical protein CRG98_005048 [Punica granatum]